MLIRRADWALVNTVQRRGAALSRVLLPSVCDSPLPSLVIVPRLIEAGATVRTFDPVGMAEAKKLIDGPAWCNDAYDAMDGADAVAILTEWNEFRGLDLARMGVLLKAPVVVDLRNIYRPEEMASAGFHYTSVGRAYIPPAA